MLAIRDKRGVKPAGEDSHAAEPSGLQEFQSTSVIGRNSAKTKSLLNRADNVDGFEAPFALAGEKQEWPVTKNLWDAAMNLFNDPSKKAHIINALPADDMDAELVKRRQNSQVKFAGKAVVVAHAVKDLSKVTMPTDECKSLEAATALYGEDGKEEHSAAECACCMKHPGVCGEDRKIPEDPHFCNMGSQFHATYQGLRAQEDLSGYLCRPRHLDSHAIARWYPSEWARACNVFPNCMFR